MDDRYKGLNIMRKIGVNIFMLMQNAGLSIEDMTKKLGYSYMDMCRIIDGKAMLPPSELNKIANVFEKTVQELIDYETEEYPFAIYKKCINQDTLNIILDLLDEYVELVEAVGK